MFSGKILGVMLAGTVLVASANADILHPDSYAYNTAINNQAAADPFP